MTDQVYSVFECPRLCREGREDVCESANDGRQSDCHNNNIEADHHRGLSRNDPRKNECDRRQTTSFLSGEAGI